LRTLPYQNGEKARLSLVYFFKWRELGPVSFHDDFLKRGFRMIGWNIVELEMYFGNMARVRFRSWMWITVGLVVMEAAMRLFDNLCFCSPLYIIFGAAFFQQRFL